MQLRFESNIIKQNLVNVYNVYNLSLNNYNDIINKDNLNAIEQTLRMQDENVIIKDFNLHYFFKRASYILDNIYCLTIC